MSKRKQFEQKYLQNLQNPIAIYRYNLKPPFSYTSGDGIFRSDSDLGYKYKYVRLPYNFNKDKYQEKLSNCWKNNITENEKNRIFKIYDNFIKNNKFKSEYSAISTQIIVFFEKNDDYICDQGIRKDIKDIIIKKKCVSCGTTSNIECDHKNDLKNNPRVLCKKTQTLDDFQPLCKHCNDVKRQVKRKMMIENKRQSAPGFKIKFTYGDETLNKNDHYWYKGTYWGDVEDFKSKLGLI